VYVRDKHGVVSFHFISFCFGRFRYVSFRTLQVPEIQ
jgi:hypothetical protein